MQVPGAVTEEERPGGQETLRCPATADPGKPLPIFSAGLAVPPWRPSSGISWPGHPLHPLRTPRPAGLTAFPLGLQWHCDLGLHLAQL